MCLARGGRCPFDNHVLPLHRGGGEYTNGKSSRYNAQVKKHPNRRGGSPKIWTVVKRKRSRHWGGACAKAAAETGRAQATERLEQQHFSFGELKSAEIIIQRKGSPRVKKKKTEQLSYDIAGRQGKGFQVAN